MINKLISLFIGLSLLFSISLKADEGMWILSLINKNYNDMKAKGFKLTSEDIYNVNTACLKDAVVGFGTPENPISFFCSAEIISNQGLILTNHHCGYDAIQSFSSLEHDYLSNGFWAYDKKDELYNPSMTASILIRIEDVTAKVIDALSSATNETERNEAIEKISEELSNSAKTEDTYNCIVKSMFDNNQFFLFVYQTYYDVRLVGAPPSSVGKFGGDTDNWMWPRHTGDFSMFRIYTNSDGKSATYSKDNIPLKPKHFFPISLKGVKKDDFAMVMGFPGTTNRYMTSTGVKEQIDMLNPIAVKVRTKKLDIIKEDMNADNKVRIQYSAKYSESSNYWKYYIGQTQTLKRLDVYGLKKTQEGKFKQWVNTDVERKKKYGDALTLIDEAYNENTTTDKVKQYIFEAIFQGPEILLAPYQTFRLYHLISRNDTASLNAEIKNLRKYAKDYYKNYNPPTDKKLFVALLEMYYKDLPEAFQFESLKLADKKYKGDFNKYAEAVFSKSIFADEKRFNDFLNNPKEKVLEKDMAFVLFQDILTIYSMIRIDEPIKKLKGSRLYAEGLMEMDKDKLYYPDANSSIRLTYGQVEDYKARDAVYYNYYTTLTGIIEKEDSTNNEFVVPSKLKQLYLSKDYGRYANKEDGQIRVCFITNNDITGGNSGSPVINGNGELIGTAFDGNWESMSGDISFEPNYQRCINVDIRYTLFIIDKYAGAKNLIQEMKIIE